MYFNGYIPAGEDEGSFIICYSAQAIVVMPFVHWAEANKELLEFLLTAIFLIAVGSCIRFKPAMMNDRHLPLWMMVQSSFSTD